MLEKLRLSAWKRNSVSAEKDKETKDAPKMFENNVSSATKGVKFAVSVFVLFVTGYILVLWNAVPIQVCLWLDHILQLYDHKKLTL